MQKLIALLAVALSSVTLHAQGVWIEENIDLSNNSRTGRILVNGATYTISPWASDLSGADLSRADLSNANLRGADLSGTDLSGADLGHANLWGADLSNANLRNAYLRWVDLSSANLSGADLSGADLRTRADLANADLSGANLRGANLLGADLSGADLSNADLSRTMLPGTDGWLLTEINNLKPQVETNTTRGEQQALQIAELQALAPAIIANTAKVGITAEQASAIESNATEINELKTMLEAMSVQMQQLNALLNDQQASIEEKDQQIAELSQRPTLEQVQDARAGSLVFRADEATNAVTLEFEIQSSENLQDWVAQPEKVTATVPLDAEKKFVRIALAQE